MTVMMQTFAPRIAAYPRAVYSALVVVSLLVAYWFAREYVGAATGNLWGPYLIGPLGWLVAAEVGYAAVKAFPAREAEDAAPVVDAKTVLIIAGLVGFFVVALQIIVGMFTEFGKSPFAHSPRWLLTNALFAGAPLVALECARVALLRIGRKYSLTLSLVVTSLGLAALQFSFHQFTEGTFKGQAEFWGGAFIPLAALGLLAGFFALYGGLRAALLISAPMTLFTYWSPFLPATEWPILALAGVAGPAVGLWIAESLFEPVEEEEDASFFKLPSVAWVLTAVMGLVIFWFSFGFFGYLPAFVPSHSMEPLIKQGDIVLTKNIDPDDVKVGDIVLYQMPNKQRILHRVVDIKPGENGQRTFIFKGDNNNAEDLFPVADDQIKSAYLFRVPKAGWLPIKLNQALGQVR